MRNYHFGFLFIIIGLHSESATSGSGIYTDVCNCDKNRQYLHASSQAQIGFLKNGTPITKDNLQELKELMRGADLEGADLSEGNLEGAKLACARLIDTNLKNANLAKANLANAIYEVKFDHLPNIVSMSQATGLELMQYCESPHALEQLKNAFKLGGWRQKEREITFAIKQTKQNKYLIDKNYLAFIFNFLFFDLTTNFGLYPGKALRILVYLIPIFTLLYIFAIWKSSAKHSIYRVWPKDRIEIKEGQAILEDSTRLERLKIGRCSLIDSLHFS